MKPVMMFILIALCAFCMQACVPEKRSVKFPSHTLPSIDQLTSIDIVPIPDWPPEYQLVSKPISFDSEEMMSFVFDYLLSARKHTLNHPISEGDCLLELNSDGAIHDLRLSILVDGRIIYFSGAHCFEVKDLDGAFRSFLSGLNKGDLEED